MKAKTAEKWYVIRTAPGAQRMARQLPDLPEEQEYRRHETIIERNLRNAGIDVMMPAFWKEIRRHRSRKLVQRRYPLLVGYAFIRHDPMKGFDTIRAIDGVAAILQISAEKGPHPFLEKDLTDIVMQIFDRQQSYRLAREAAIEDARRRRRQDLNSVLGRLLPKGRSRAVSLRYHADSCIESLPSALKDKVLGIIAALDNLQDESTLDEFREAV